MSEERWKVFKVAVAESGVQTGDTETMAQRTHM